MSLMYLYTWQYLKKIKSPTTTAQTEMRISNNYTTEIKWGLGWCRG